MLIANFSRMELANKNDTYLLVINGKPQGPFSIDELRVHKIKPGDFVRTPAMDDYKEAHEVAELRQLFGFEKQAVIPQYFASFDQRLLASAIDWFCVLGICISLAFIASVFIAPELRIMVAFSLIGIVPLTKIIYHIIMECTAKQGTYGKQLLKIKVCDLQGYRISMARSIGRNLCKIISVAPFFIGYLYSFFNKQQQCMHDMIAGTLVIKDRLI